MYLFLALVIGCIIGLMVGFNGAATLIRLKLTQLEKLKSLKNILETIHSSEELSEQDFKQGMETVTFYIKLFQPFDMYLRGIKDKIEKIEKIEENIKHLQKGQLVPYDWSSLS